MAAILVNESKTRMLDARLAAEPFTTVQIVLLTNTTLDVYTVYADIVPVTGTGYGSIVVTGWTAVSLMADDHAYSVANIVTFENTGGTDWDAAYGWYIFNYGALELVLCELFPTPITLGPGEALPMIPRHTLTGE